MTPADLLDILRCPQTGQRLTACEPDLLARLNQVIAQPAVSGVLTLAGHPVARTLDGGLVRRDGTALYPIWDGIPVLLADEAISLPPP